MILYQLKDLNINYGETNDCYRDRAKLICVTHASMFYPRAKQFQNKLILYCRLYDIYNKFLHILYVNLYITKLILILTGKPFEFFSSLFLYPLTFATLCKSYYCYTSDCTLLISRMEHILIFCGSLKNFQSIQN